MQLGYDHHYSDTKSCDGLNYYKFFKMEEAFWKISILRSRRSISYQVFKKFPMKLNIWDF